MWLRLNAPKCGEEEETPDHIVFQCRKIRWVRENDLGWDSWDALSSRKWVRMVDSGRVDNEGRQNVLCDQFSIHVFRFVVLYACGETRDLFGI